MAEGELVDLEEEEKQEYLALLGQDEPALNTIIRKGYEMLNLFFYTFLLLAEISQRSKSMGS